MKNVLILSCLLMFVMSDLSAQCPPSNEPGIHIVQRNETLYRISINYGISVSELCSWNNMKETDMLQACRKLRVSGGAIQTSQSSGTVSTPTNNTRRLQRQAGNRHVVQVGETAADLARLYGYTEERFREFNAMGGEVLTPGSIVLSHDCACDRISFSENASPSGNTTQQNYQPDYATNYSPETTTYYDKPNTQPTKHVPLSTSDTNSSSTSSGNTNSVANNTMAGVSSASFLRPSEMEMVNEINMMRANPKGYVKYINEYVADQRANNGFPVSQAVVDELIAELNNLGPLSQLKPKECVYIAAKKHGQDILHMGRTDHIGSDGAWPWDRVRRECPDLSDGNENLVGGPSSVRESVVILLIDEGIPNRGHRKTLLRSDWVYVACYSIGKVGMMPNCWVQKFGF